ncbi:hypothetical protein E8E11_009777 [Didymella keratinophila]|nr:hypothetical protein E8E11_009777 [Didymella keratinophila]
MNSLKESALRHFKSAVTGKEYKKTSERSVEIQDFQYHGYIGTAPQPKHFQSPSSYDYNTPYNADDYLTIPPPIRDKPPHTTRVVEPSQPICTHRTTTEYQPLPRTYPTNEEHEESFDSTVAEAAAELDATHPQVTDEERPASESSHEIHVLRARQAFFRAEQRHPEIKGPENEPLEETVIRLLKLYESSVGSSGLSGLQVECSTLKQKLETSEATVYTKNVQIGHTEHEIGRLRAQINDQSARFNRDSDALHAEIARLKHEYSHGNRLRKEKAEIQRLNDAHDTKMRLARVEADRIANNLNLQLGMAKSELQTAQADWAKQLETLKKDHDQEIDKRTRKVQAQYEGTIYTLEQQIKKLETQLNEEKLQMKAMGARYNEEVERVKKTAEREKQMEKERLAQDFNLKESQMRVQTEELKRDLAKRDHFKGLTDREVASKFKALAGEVDDFSRLDWDTRLESSWMMPEQELRQMQPRGTRRLKQQIIQTAVWAKLYNSVFRTPFCVLGLDGEELDKDWIDIYRQDRPAFDWPDLSQDIEQRRYENAKAFLKAINNAAESSSDSIRLRQSFDSSVAVAVDSLCRELETVKTITSRDREVIDSIVRLAGKLWLEFCSQRYRLMVISSSDNDNDMFPVVGDKKPLRLVTRPDLRRYGDSAGKSLTIGEPIAGWQKCVQTYPRL